ncbi:polysaccharide pyruvyl transferase family protein [Ruminococcus sp.]|uniref:polysaccharide pyruvyl transferase family protein n=1 Tax=Ruminococcus sp. TaxID=41978 RepID=UPI0025F3C447|nr:polysaccharide pyruvyl transferase family protein [Ruminococcus sp.]
MKIGIMTWFYADNYGARLHSYALQQVINNMGHECVMIAYYPKKLLSMNIRMNLNYKNRKKHPVLALKCLRRNIMFFHARKEMYRISKRVNNANDIDNLGLDVLILGSDEVFKVSHPFFDKLYYGVGVKTPKVTYAPSAGQTSDDYMLPKEIVNAINNYSALSVRDKHTYALIKRSTGREAQIVLDPTFLFDFVDITQNINCRNYILIYSFDTLDEYYSQITEYANQQKLQIICVGRYCKWANRSYEYIDIKKWLGMFQNATIVVTDSFHGTVFAIKNKKRFVLMGRSDKINKINDLMSECGVSLPFYNSDISIEDYLKIPFSYSKITDLIERKKETSLNYIKSSLDSIKGC